MYKAGQIFIIWVMATCTTGIPLGILIERNDPAAKTNISAKVVPDKNEQLTKDMLLSQSRLNSKLLDRLDAIDREIEELKKAKR